MTVLIYWDCPTYPEIIVLRVNMDGYVLEGDCRDLLKQMVDEGITVQSVVCDPPYGIGMMGRYWDHPDNIAFQSETWRLCFDLLPPGGHLVAFGSTRTYHRLVCAVEDAGFEIRDQLAWVYGTGFPKSMNVANAIDKAARGVPQGGTDPTSPNHGKYKGGCSDDNPSGRGFGAGPGQFMQEPGENVDRELVSAAQPWIGYGTALKPAWECIVLARKPLIGTVAQNVLEHQTGALNIDGCRVKTTDSLGGGDQNAKTKIKPEGWDRPWMQNEEAKAAHAERVNTNVTKAESLGRFPANLCHDGSDEVIEVFESFGNHGGGDKRGDCTGRRPGGFGNVGNENGDGEPNSYMYADSGSAARFFYSAKTSKRERGDSKHPTIKPLALMRWLVRLVTPPGGMVLDPFAGSGTTGEAAKLEGFSYILIEREPEFIADIEKRLNR